MPFTCFKISWPIRNLWDFETPPQLHPNPNQSFEWLLLAGPVSLPSFSLGTKMLSLHIYLFTVTAKMRPTKVRSMEALHFVYLRAYHSCKKSGWSDDGNRLIEPSNTATDFFCDNYVSFRWLLLIWVIWNDEQCIDAWWVLFCIIRGSHERHCTDTRENPLSFVLNSHFVSPNNLLSWNLLSLVLRLFILIMILPAIFTLL